MFACGNSRCWGVFSCAASVLAMLVGATTWPIWFLTKASPHKHQTTSFLWAQATSQSHRRPKGPPAPGAAAGDRGPAGRRRPIVLPESAGRKTEEEPGRCPKLEMFSSCLSVFVWGMMSTAIFAGYLEQSLKLSLARHPNHSKEETSHNSQSGNRWLPNPGKGKSSPRKRVWDPSERVKSHVRHPRSSVFDLVGFDSLRFDVWPCRPRFDV